MFLRKKQPTKNVQKRTNSHVSTSEGKEENVGGKVYEFKVILLGSVGVGKTSLTKRYTDDSFCGGEMPLTLEFKAKNVNINGKRGMIKVLEMPGCRRTIGPCVRHCHGVLVVFDITLRSSFNEVRNWMGIIKEYRYDALSVLLVGNKSDISFREVSHQEAMSFAKTYKIHYVETSAKSDVNVTRAFEMLYAEMCMRVYNDPLPMDFFEADGEVSDKSRVKSEITQSFSEHIGLEDLEVSGKRLIDGANTSKTMENACEPCSDENLNTGADEFIATPAETCCIHAREFIKFYCSMHNFIGCAGCMMPDHKDCRPRNIKDIALGYRDTKDYKELFTNMKSLKISCEEKVDAFKGEINTNASMIGKALADLEEFRDNVNTYLDKEAWHLQQQSVDIAIRKKEMLTRQILKCKNISSKISKMENELDPEKNSNRSLFINSVKGRSLAVEIEKDIFQNQRDDRLVMIEFVPDKKLLALICSEGNFGQIDTQENTTLDN